MSLDFTVLGKPGRDNALFIRVEPGTELKRFLFDCGEGTLNKLKHSEIRNIDALFLSHLHIDHIAGFDYLFRRIYDRNKQPFRIFGPAGSTEIIHHRLRGFKWNLRSELEGSIIVNEILGSRICSSKFFASEGFSKKHFLKEEEFKNVIYEDENISVSASELNHKIISMGYSLREKDTLNIRKSKLTELGIKGGAWLEKVKDLNISGDSFIKIGNKSYKLEKLRSMLLVRTPGEKISYLTDFIFDEKSVKAAKLVAKDSDYLVCESQYLALDEELAKKNYHLYSKQAAEIAKLAEVKKLILFHVSDRYNKKELTNILEEAKGVFKETFYPEGWKIT